PAGATLAVRELRRDGELALPADLHTYDTLIPPLNDLASAELEVEGLVAVLRAVELLPVGECARVVHAHLVARLGLLALADDEILHVELGIRIGGRRRGGGRG